MALNRFRWHSLQTRVTLLTLIIFLVSIWSLSLYSSHMLRLDMQRVLGEQQYSTVSFVAAKINRDMENRLAALSQVAAELSPGTMGDTAALQTRLEQHQTLQVLFNAGIWVTRTDGIAVANLPKSLARMGLDFSDRDYIRDVLSSGKAAIGRPAIGVTLHLPMFAMAVPILDADGKVTGVLAGGTNLSKANFLDEMTDGRYGKTGGYLLIAPKHQLIVASSDNTRVMQPVPAAGVNQMHDQYMQGYEGYGVATNSRGVDELTAARRIAVANWFVVAALPSAEAFAPIAELLRRIQLGTLVLTLVAALLTWWAISRMLKRQLSPILAASRALTRQADTQQPAVPLAIAEHDEIGELVGSFNRLLQSSAQRENLLKQILNTSSVAIFLVDKHGRITQANQRMAEMFRCTVEQLVGSEYVSLIHPDERDVGRQRMQNLMVLDTPLVDLDRLYWRADHSQFWGHLTGNRFIDANGMESGLIGVIADITARKQAELHEQHRQSVLKMLTDRVTLKTILDQMVRDVEDFRPGMLCSIFLLDDAGKHLLHGAAPSLPDFYNQAIDGIAVGPDVGSCGAAAFSGQRVIAADIQSHPNWIPYRDIAAQAGLASCWSHPIVSSQGLVQGTFSIYQRQPSTPTPADLTLIEDAAILASLAIDKSADFGKLQLAASVFSHAREGILITDAQGTIVQVNDTFTRITGFSREEAVGQNPRILGSGRQSTEQYAAMWQSLNQDGYWSGEIWNRRKSGEVYAEMQTIGAVRDAAGRTQHYVSLFTDITAAKEHQQQLEHIAHFDTLTNLPNRVLLADRLRQALLQSERRGQMLAAVYLDLDGFKKVNDLHGHDVGDELLIAIAQRMKGALREGDTLARIGGDEFVAVLVDLEGPHDCEPALHRLLRAASQKVTVGDATLQLSASIGVTMYPQDGVDADRLIRQADQSMYLAKDAGKNRYHFFDINSAEATRSQRESLDHIRTAIDQSQFVLHYQPKVNLKTGAVVGAEALIRWQHPHRGLLAPGFFLPVIEGDDMSVELGDWVIDTALGQISAWRAAGLELPVSVNVSARQLQHGNFVERLTLALANHPDVGHGQLELEILETRALEDMTQVSALMHACLGLGVAFALDDFGTGYSSLTYLKRLPAHLLKIDQSFVRDMLDDTDDLAIVQSVIGLARAFHRNVIAEGVETAAHGAKLLELGCELVQGYGIARPMPADALPLWVGAWNTDAVWTA